MTADLHHDATAHDAPTADLRRFYLAHLALRTHADDICRALAALRPGEGDKAADEWVKEHNAALPGAA